MHLWVGLGSQLYGWLGAFLAAAAFALIPFVIIRRKEPSSTIAWILTLLFLPAVGAILFLLFGRDRVRWPAKRKRQADAMVRGTVVARTGDAGVDLSRAPADLTELAKQMFHVGALLTGGSASTGNRVEVLSDGKKVYEPLGVAIHSP